MNPSRFRRHFAGLLCGSLWSVAFAQQFPPAPVATTRAVERNVAAGQTFVATILPLKRAVVGSAVAGRVVELAAHKGERVEQRAPLCKLLTATIELELKGARAALELRKQELLELENGALPSEIEQAKAELQRSKVALENAKLRFDRRESLRDSQAISQEVLDEAEAMMRQAIQDYYVAKASHRLVLDGPREEKIAQAAAQVAMQEALIEQIEDRIKKYTMISRFAGYVVAEHTEEGAWVNAGDPVMEVVALDDVEVQAFVTEQHIPHVTLDATVRVEVPAVSGHVFTGTVASIVPQADMQARTFPVNIRVTNLIEETGPILKAGMYARVELPTGEMQKAIMVPKDALVLGGPTPQIYVVEPADAADVEGKMGTARPVTVELGVATADLIQVKGAVQAGQLVVVEGNERLRPGQDVVVTRMVLPTTPTATEE